MATPTPTTTTTPPLPLFLRQTRAELHAKFIDLEWQQRNRLLAGSQPPPDPAAQPSPWTRLSGEHITSKNRYANVEPFALNRVRLRGSGSSDGGDTGDAGARGAGYGGDYINASPIRLGARRYIATQGPKDTGVRDFWRMVLQECDPGGKAPAVVVMLTQTHEAGREKCFRYYPLDAGESPLDIPEEDGVGGRVELESVELDAQARCEVRRMRVRVRSRRHRSQTQAEGRGGDEDAEAATNGHATVMEQELELELDDVVQEKEVRHLLFSGWPDFLIPEGADRAALVQLVALSNTLNTPAPSLPPQQAPAPSHPATNGSTPHPLNPSQPADQTQNPRIIHCSAGVGRSGTFIALDYLLHLLHTGALDNPDALPKLDALSTPDTPDKLPDEERDPIAETVDCLRQQRMMMVQGEAQFVFLYEVVRELWVRRWMERARGGGGNELGVA
ncbi:tyrosine protein phosphatase 1 [Teratosphaeriaceae sp. CCFEE 6253]|nr:tyrosine protein phosphatase 1 [Teratosphaeriaceae sp. CCFEE 6253]